VKTIADQTRKLIVLATDENYLNHIKEAVSLSMSINQYWLVFNCGIQLWNTYLPIFESEILSIQEQLKLILNQDGEIISFMFVNLPSKKQVMPHVDWLPFASKFDRFHIPVITNNDCIFTVGDESKNLKVGELWEINNDKFIHSVYNGGETDRVHIIMDWKRKTPTD
jgi:aspartyl/asparaginyl beta-hydroxylase (cupin superfamily)